MVLILPFDRGANLPQPAQHYLPSLNPYQVQESGKFKSYRVSHLFHPLKVPSATDPFSKGTFVTNGKYFGVVSRVNPHAEDFIQIAWWESNSEKVDEKFWYSLDFLQALKIKPLPLFIPQRTFITIPAGTSVRTDEGELVQFAETIFWLKNVDEVGYHLLNQTESWVFPLKNFPGIPFACVNELVHPKILEAACRLNFSDLKIRASFWLSQNSPTNLLELLHGGSQIGSDLFEEFSHSDYLDKQTYIEPDLESAWQAAFTSYIDELKQSCGISGFKRGGRVVQSTPLINKNDYAFRFGTVVEIDLYGIHPIVVEWEREENICRYNHSQLELHSISPINQVVKLSSRVGYERSIDGKFYQAVVGLSSKSAAHSWWRAIKRELGEISELHPNYAPQIQHFKNHIEAKYFYLASRPRQKTLSARLRHLQKVGNWSLKTTRSS